MVVHERVYRFLEPYNFIKESDDKPLLGRFVTSIKTPIFHPKISNSLSSLVGDQNPTNNAPDVEFDPFLDDEDDFDDSHLVRVIKRYITDFHVDGEKLLYPSNQAAVLLSVHSSPQKPKRDILKPSTSAMHKSQFAILTIQRKPFAISSKSRRLKKWWNN
jgi:hypothetical protein